MIKVRSNLTTKEAAKDRVGNNQLMSQEEEVII